MSEEYIKERYVLSLDVGTTTVRCHVYDKTCNIKGSSSKKIELIHPQVGWSEMDPDKLVDQSKACIKEAIQASGIEASQIASLGIATQRGTFVTWDSETGKPYHNFITWQDLRASDHVKLWNNSYTMKALTSGSKFLHLITGKKRYLAASVLKFLTKQVTMRLIWVFQNIPELRKYAAEGKLRFGCIDTWLLWKLTGEKVHATDYSNASSTGLFDPFQIEWSGIVCNLVNIPMSIFPEVKDTSGHFGFTSEELVGVHIPITCLVADQQSALFGHCCFEAGDVKVTMGTGTFVDLNTGKTPHASIAGLYPVIGWKIGDEMTFVAEGQAADTGSILEWAQSIGVLDDIRQSSDIAQSVPDSGGVYFVPAFSGIQAPINDDKATTCMIGMSPQTTKAHIVRSILEALAFRFKLLYETILVETKIPLSHIRADGGVTQNDFLVQLMSDLVNQSVERSNDADITSLGAAFLAGLAVGVWNSKEELCELRGDNTIYNPQPTWKDYKYTFHQWEKAVSRSLHWYNPT
ncbi:hypothetical protein LOTGIDRAFT_225946 [Lottia gigantea]|uniref:Glycerol kinase 5 n=1 Tax=Lottia gigantea TaxID=225164 RepID=V4A8I4_LOTGI|nr:hypothetical protein LOTGIDRAFT_225946 [Lottia gigantea]ESP00284.1 hypothetical protein LOTGIDRAFT_225946 [Lottia gigantea]